MASRAKYQNICPNVAKKPCSVISPDAEGKQYVIYVHNIFKEIKAIYKRSYFINNCMF